MRLSCAGTAPLGRHVSQVFGLRSEKEMVWIDASANVALVTNEQAVRDGAIGEFPRDAMGKQSPTLAPSLADEAVAPPPNTSLPQPTTVRLDDALPEPFGEGSSRGLFSHVENITSVMRKVSSQFKPDAPKAWVA